MHFHQVFHEAPFLEEAIPSDPLAAHLSAWEWRLVMLLAHMLGEIPSGFEETIWVPGGPEQRTPFVEATCVEMRFYKAPLAIGLK